MNSQNTVFPISKHRLIELRHFAFDRGMSVSSAFRHLAGRIGTDIRAVRPDVPYYPTATLPVFLRNHVTESLAVAVLDLGLDPSHVGEMVVQSAIAAGVLPDLATLKAGASA